jgi:hypothetical protein
MQLLGRAKFLMEDENPKGKVMFLGGEMPGTPDNRIPI